MSKSSAPSLETAIAYRMSLWWASFFILFSSVSCYPAFRQCCSLIISFESSIMCVRLSAEGIHRLYELQHLMMPLNAAVQLQWRSLYVSSCQRNKLVFRVHVIAILWPIFFFFWPCHVWGSVVIRQTKYVNLLIMVSDQNMMWNRQHLLLFHFEN